MNLLCANSMVSFSVSVESHAFATGIGNLCVAERPLCSLFNAADKLDRLETGWGHQFGNAVRCSTAERTH